MSDSKTNGARETVSVKIYTETRDLLEDEKIAIRKRTGVKPDYADQIETHIQRSISAIADSKTERNPATRLKTPSRTDEKQSDSWRVVPFSEQPLQVTDDRLTLHTSRLEEEVHAKLAELLQLGGTGSIRLLSKSILSAYEVYDEYEKTGGSSSGDS
jgi:hypothetical protein